MLSVTSGQIESITRRFHNSFKAPVHCVPCIKLYTSTYPFQDWNFVDSGILFITNWKERGVHLFEVYSPTHQSLIWEIEIYSNLHIKKLNRTMLSFEGDNVIFGFQFPNNIDIDEFIHKLHQYHQPEEDRSGSFEKANEEDSNSIENFGKKVKGVFKGLFGGEKKKEIIIARPANFTKTGHVGVDKSGKFIIDAKTGSDAEKFYSSLSTISSNSSQTNEQTSMPQRQVSSPRMPPPSKPNNPYQKPPSSPNNSFSQPSTQNTVPKSFGSPLSSSSGIPPSQSKPFPTNNKIPSLPTSGAPPPLPSSGMPPPPPSGMPPPPPSSGMPPPPISSNLGGTDNQSRNALFDDIRKGAKLKKVDPNQIKRPLSPKSLAKGSSGGGSGGSGSNISASSNPMMAAIQARREQMKLNGSSKMNQSTQNSSTNKIESKFSNPPLNPMSELQKKIMQRNQESNIPKSQPSSSIPQPKMLPTSQTAPSTTPSTLKQPVSIPKVVPTANPTILPSTQQAQQKPVPKTVPPSQFRPREIVIAIYDFTAQQSGDLSFKKDDLIEIIEKNSSGWFKGRIGDRQGEFPSNYTKPI